MMEGRRLSKDKIQLLTQALNAATSSLNLAKQLLSEIEHAGGVGESPGLVGKYDGMFMITEAGKKYPVPDNYSAKTKLVYGDKLKMIEGPEGRRFKLLEEAPRVEAEGQLAVKDGRFEALGKDGSYHLIQGAVRWWGGAEGDKVKLLVPKDEKRAPFAALVEVIGKKPGQGMTSERPSRPAPGEVRPSRPAPAPKVEKTTAVGGVPPKAGKEEEKKPAPRPVGRPAPAAKKEERKPAPKREVKKEAPKEAPKKTAKLSEEELR